MKNPRIKGRFSKKAVSLAVTLALAVVLGAGYEVAAQVYPLETNNLLQRFELWRAGVTEGRVGGMHAYTQDGCDPRQGPKACSCVVLIHGLADDALTWRKILLWREWKRPVRLVALDLPGSGETPAPANSADYRVKTQALALKAALAPICPSWMVVGNSLGGWISAWLTLEWPEGVEKLLLVDSAGLKANKSAVPDAFTVPTIDSMKEFQKRAYFHSRPIPENIWKEVVRRMAGSNARAVLTAQVPEDFLDSRLGLLHRPTLVLWGAADRVIEPGVGELMHQLIPGSLWREVPECGHLPQKECPLSLIQAMGEMVQLGNM